MENKGFQPTNIPKLESGQIENSTPKDFLSTLKIVVTKLKSLQEKRIKARKYKPILETTSKGRAVTIQTIAWDNTSLNTYKQMANTRQVVLVALDSQTQILTQ
jgi:hypothetical protein